MRTSDRLAAPKNRIAFPLDFSDMASAWKAAEQLKGEVGIFKVGLELFSSAGPQALSLASSALAELFVDLKLHDIPETVDRAIGAVAKYEPRYLTVHTSGGAKMLERAVSRTEIEGAGEIVVLGVTVLTSLTDKDLAAQGIGGMTGDHALSLAHLAWEAGVRGFVCSPIEVAQLRAALGPRALLVTPGVRPAGAEANDQARVATPTQAITNGADILVVGRPIRDAPDPVAATRSIAKEIAAGLERRQKNI